LTSVPHLDLGSQGATESACKRLVVVHAAAEREGISQQENAPSSLRRALGSAKAVLVQGRVRDLGAVAQCNETGLGWREAKQRNRIDFVAKLSIRPENPACDLSHAE